MIEPVFMCHVNSPQGLEVSDLRHEMKEKIISLDLRSYQRDENPSKSTEHKNTNKKSTT